MTRAGNHRAPLGRSQESFLRLTSTYLQLSFDECEAVDPLRIDWCLADDPAITHVALVHCETTTSGHT